MKLLKGILFGAFILLGILTPTVTVLYGASTTTTLESIQGAPAVASTQLLPQIIGEENVPPEFLDDVIVILGTIEAKIIAFGIILEILFKFIPSKQALSILIPAKYTIEGLIWILKWILNVLIIRFINLANNSKEKVQPKI